MKTKINLDIYEFGANDKRAVAAFRRVLDCEVEKYFRDGEEVPPEEIFRDPNLPLNGFVPEILPDYVRNLTGRSQGSVVRTDKMADISVGAVWLWYRGDLSHERARDHWKRKGYLVRPVRQSLAVVGRNDASGPDISGDRYLAFYGKNVLRIVYSSIDEFLRNFEHLDPKRDLR